MNPPSRGDGIASTLASARLSAAGDLSVAGWAAGPDGAGLQVALLRGGKLAGVAATRRIRTDVARALGRPALAKARIGLILVLPGQPPCGAGGDDVLAVAFDAASRFAILPGAPAIEGCP